MRTIDVTSEWTELTTADSTKISFAILYPTAKNDGVYLAFTTGSAPTEAVGIFFQRNPVTPIYTLTLADVDPESTPTRVWAKGVTSANRVVVSAS